jgi:hypothetical protein
LFDAFDALGRERSSQNDVGEIRRVVNSFLQFLDQDDSDSLVLGATNRALAALRGPLSAPIALLPIATDERSQRASSCQRASRRSERGEDDRLAPSVRGRYPLTSSMMMRFSVFLLG